MATIEHTFATFPSQGLHYVVVTWETLTTTNDTGRAVKIPEWADKTIMFTATWGAGGSVSLEGSNDGTTYFILNEPDNTSPVTATANALMTVLANPLWVRPRVTAGDGTTDVDVKLIATQKRPR